MSDFLQLLNAFQKLSASQTEAIRNEELSLLLQITEEKGRLLEQLLALATTPAVNSEPCRLAFQRLLELEREAGRLCAEAKLNLAGQLRSLDLVSRRLCAVDASYRLNPTSGRKGACLNEDV